MGSLEKDCFRLNGFVQLSSWIYAGIKKNWNAVVYIEVVYIEIDNGLLLWRRMLQKSPKILYKVNAKI